MSRSQRAFVALVIAVTLAQAVSLTSRAGRGETDFGVFYRTCRLLAAGIGAEIYTRLDAVTTWPISLSPTGLAIFQPFAWLNPRPAGAAWGLFNLALLGVSLVGLRDVLDDRDRGQASRVYLPAAMLLLILSIASIQVGQFSVLFVACWILAFRALLRGRFFWTAFLLAIPGAIKLYPLLMVAVPLSLARSLKIGVRHVILVALSLLVMCLLVPATMYGARSWALNVSFWQNVILNPAGQVQYMQFPRFGNQSFDSLLLRYFTHEPDFHDVFVNIPHLALGSRGRRDREPRACPRPRDHGRHGVAPAAPITNVRPAGSGRDGGAWSSTCICCSRKPRRVMRSIRCLGSSRCCSRPPIAVDRQPLPAAGVDGSKLWSSLPCSCFCSRCRFRRSVSAFWGRCGCGSKTSAAFVGIERANRARARFMDPGGTVLRWAACNSY